MAFTIRVPRGVVCGITSFNAPLNFVAHKAAPALASGNTVVLKAPQATPFSAALLCEILLEAGLPPAHVNLVQGPGSEVGPLAGREPADPLLHLHRQHRGRQAAAARVGLRPIALELGSIAAHHRLRRRRSRSRGAAHRQLGVPPRRPGLHVDAAAVRAATGRSTPFLETAGRGHRAAEGRRPARSRDAGRADDQRSRGGAGRALGRTRRSPPARGCVAGGDATRRAADADDPRSTSRATMRVLCEEIFAPGGVGDSVRHARRGDRRRSTPRAFGLAAGIFTRDISTALTAARRMHVGVVHINESSSSRVDLMPFAGVKDSGARPRRSEVRDAGDDRRAAHHDQPVA